MTNLNLFIPLTKIDEEKRLVYGVATAEVKDRTGEICDYATTKPYYEAWSTDVHKASGGKSVGNLRAMHGKIAAGKITDIAFDDTNKKIEICAKVVDDQEWKKVLEGVYTGFSQGGAYVKRWDDPTDSTIKRYTADPTEVSLVDVPCLKTATFEVIKADGQTEMRKFHTKEETVSQPTNDEVAAKAVELAKVAGDETKWAGFIDAAREELVKVTEPATPPIIATTAETIVEKTTEVAIDNDVKQVWQARDGKTFAKKAEVIAYHKQLDTEALVKNTSAPALAALEKITALLATDTATTTEVTEVAKVDEPAADGDNADHTALSTQHRAASKDFTKKANDHATDGNAKQAGAQRDNARAHDDAADLHDHANALQTANHPDAAKATKDAYSATDKANQKTGTAIKCSKVAEHSDLQKGLPTVAELAYLIERLKYIGSAVHMEAKQEGDDSPLPGKLHTNVADLCDTLNAMCLEETAELIAGQNVDDINNVPNVFNMAAGMAEGRFDALVKYVGITDSLEKLRPTLEKVGAAISAANHTKIQQAHDALLELGAICGGKDATEHVTEKHVHADELTKALEKSDALQKAFNEVTDKLQTITVDIEKLKTQPVPRPNLRVVNKGDDLGLPSRDDADIIKAYNALSPEEKSLMLIKVAQSLPQNALSRG